MVCSTSSHTLHTAVYSAMNVCLESACVNVYSALLQGMIWVLDKCNNMILLVMSFFQTVKKIDF